MMIKCCFIASVISFVFAFVTFKMLPLLANNYSTDLIRTCIGIALICGVANGVISIILYNRK